MLYKKALFTSKSSPQPLLGSWGHGHHWTSGRLHCWQEYLALNPTTSAGCFEAIERWIHKSHLSATKGKWYDSIPADLSNKHCPAPKCSWSSLGESVQRTVSPLSLDCLWLNLPELRHCGMLDTRHVCVSNTCWPGTGCTTLRFQC